MTRTIFLDTEQTSLDRRTRRIWDLAYIIRDPDLGPADVEHQHFLDVPLDRADPFALDIGRYWERHPNPYQDPNLDPDDVYWGSKLARKVAAHFKGATLVGAVPSFDEETLAKLLRSHGLRETWNHRLLDVGTLVMGWLAGDGGTDLPTAPWSLDRCATAFGLQWPDGDRHTALGDARMVRDLYDRVLARGGA